jgi:hypothetical protein
MMADIHSRQVIHLDTKDWIGLARGYYGRAPDLQKIAQQVREKSESGELIFPLCITHIDEITRNLSQERRERLAEYMVLVSQGWAMLPAPFVIEPETEDACLRKLGHPGYDLRAFAIKKGLSQLVGARADIEFENTDPRKVLPESRKAELKSFLLEKLESPETLLWLLKRKFDELDRLDLKKMRNDSIQFAQKLEQMRLSESQSIRDNDLRRRATLAKYFVQVIWPKIRAFLISVRVNPKDFADIELSDQEKTIQFFQSVPTSYCAVQLTLHRDMQRSRRIQPNDQNDIMSLSIAIPYSDVVVTETMWHSVISRTKLDKLYRTTVLKSTKQLVPLLELKDA